MVSVIEGLTEDVLSDPDRRYACFALLAVQLRKKSPAVTADVLHHVFDTAMTLRLKLDHEKADKPSINIGDSVQDGDIVSRF